jgi:hypothetical protein
MNEVSALANTECYGKSARLSTHHRRIENFDNAFRRKMKNEYSAISIRRVSFILSMEYE